MIRQGRNGVLVGSSGRGLEHARRGRIGMRCDARPAADARGGAAWLRGASGRWGREQ
jgi:hypothetical protein